VHLIKYYLGGNCVGTLLVDLGLELLNTFCITGHLIFKQLEGLIGSLQLGSELCNLSIARLSSLVAVLQALKQGKPCAMDTFCVSLLTECGNLPSSTF
jgi:hypothetical protein